MRNARHVRETAETAVRVELSLDDASFTQVRTGIRMLDHLLVQFAFYARTGLIIEASSSDGIAHHLVEDVAIVLGATLAEALGERRSIVRYAGETIAMDDALVRCAVDFGGRAFSRVDLALTRMAVEDLSSDLIVHFFSSFAANAGVTLHLDRLAGVDEHHVAEAAFKALGTVTRRACAIDPVGPLVASTKGVLV